MVFRDFDSESTGIPFLFTFLIFIAYPTLASLWFQKRFILRLHIPSRLSRALRVRRQEAHEISTSLDFPAWSGTCFLECFSRLGALYCTRPQLFRTIVEAKVSSTAFIAFTCVCHVRKPIASTHFYKFTLLTDS